MTEKNVLIFQGGWDGHEPVKVAARFAKLMEKNGYTCKIYDNQEVRSKGKHCEGRSGRPRACRMPRRDVRCVP